MKQEYILVLIAVLLAGFIGVQIGKPDSFGTDGHMMGGGSYMSNDDMGGMMQMMDGMLAGKKGAELDRAFLGAMIPHHQGAVNMCEQVLRDGLHDELKALCRDIITSQTREINQMRTWQKQW